MSLSRLRLGLLGKELRTARRHGRRAGRRLELERLEVRLVLQGSTWTGLGTDANWMTAANWDVLPVSGTGTDLTFPSTGAQLTNFDDFGPAATFGALSISGSGYSISPATGSGSTISFTSVDSSQTSGSNTFDVPIVLSAATTMTVDDAGATLVLGGLISGPRALTRLAVAC